MTQETKRKLTIIGVVAGVEIAFGVIEGIVMPNLFDRKKGEPFFIPSSKEIVKIGGTLLATGIVSGVVCDYVLEKWKVKDENRAKAITAVAIGLNVVETILTYNINKKDKSIGFPKVAEFAPAFVFLCLTSIVGGYASDNLISGLLPAEINGGDAMTQEQLLADKI